MKYKTWITTLVKHRTTIVVIFIFLFGCWLRSMHFSSWLWDMGGYDESRDMLVARHLIEYGDSIWRGPLASGGQNILANSPFYYYFIAIIWAATRSPEVFMIAWAILMAAIIPLGYRFGNRLWDKTAGLYIALFFAVHPTFVGMGKYLSQVNLIPLWMLVVLNILISKKPWSVLQLAVGLSFLFLGLHIHYGSLIVIASLFVWMCWIWWHNSSLTSPIARGICFALMAEYLIVLWVYSSYKYSPFDQLIFFERNVQNAHPSIVTVIVGAMRDVGALLWVHVYDWRAWCVAILGIVGYGIGFFTKFFTPRVRNYCMWGSTCLLSAYGAVGLYLGHLSLAYFYSFLPLYVIIFGLFFRGIYQRNNYIGMTIMAFFCLLLSYQSWREMQPPRSMSQYKSYENIANAIAVDYKNMEIDMTKQDTYLFTLATLSTAPYLVYDGWANGSTWYWLEEIFKEKLIVTTDSVTNFQPLVKNPKYFYVICDHRESGKEAASVCLQRFIKERDYISDVYTDVFSSDSHTVWRFDITKAPTSSGYNVAYDELLRPKE